MPEVFEDHIAVRQFLCGHNKVVEDWIARHWPDVEGLNGPVDTSRISRALAGQPVATPIVNALRQIHSDMRADPWPWCKPPDVDDFASDYRPLSWWYDALEPAVSWSRFERIKQFPLTDGDREIVAARLAEWSSRLREACDRFKADTRLVRAVQSDMRPEFQHWVDDGGWQLVDSVAFKLFHGKKLRRRVGEPGLHGCTAEEVGLAYALMDAIRPLPLVKEARLAYAQPRGVPEHDHYSEEVAPWNGDEFDGIEIATSDLFDRVRHQVRFWWDGERYKVEDVQPFAQVFDDGWREPTRDERDLLETGMRREMITREEFAQTREEWVARLHQIQLEEAKEKPWIYLTAPTLEDAEEAFESRLASIDDEAAADERREIARRRMEFKRSLRRRT